MASRKLQRATALIRQSVSKVILYELNDPRMKATVTVTRVKVSPELRTADVFVSLMGEDGDVRSTFRALQHAAGHITSLVGSRLEFRNTPVLRFHLDDSLKKGFQVTRLIDQAMEEIRQKEAAHARQAEADGDAPATDADAPGRTDPVAEPGSGQ
jgi:ribosome-binding factor A